MIGFYHIDIDKEANLMYLCLALHALEEKMRILVEIHLNKGITKGEALRIDSKRGQLFTPVEGHDSMIREAMNQSFGDTRINRDITIQAHVPNERAISTLRQDFNAKVKKI